MEKIVRFGVSMEKELLKSFDTYIKKEKYKNRSEAIRDLIRKELVSEEWEEGKEVAGCIVLVYNHHKRELVEKIMDIQHNFHQVVISTQHVHMDKENCLEIIAVKGNVEKIKSLYNSLKSLKSANSFTSYFAFTKTTFSTT